MSANIIIEAFVNKETSEGLYILLKTVTKCAKLLLARKGIERECKHAASCKHGPKCEFKHNKKSDETAFTQLQELKNAATKLFDDKVIHERKITSLEKSIKQNNSEKIEISNKISNVSKELIVLKNAFKELAQEKLHQEKKIDKC